MPPRGPSRPGGTSNRAGYSDDTITHETTNPDGSGPATERRKRPDPAVVLVFAGVVLALVGLIGDLVWHGLHPAEHGALLDLGSSEAPWHIALLGGIGVVAVGAAVWAVNLRTAAGSALAAALVLLLVVAAAAGGWSVAVGRDEAGTLATPGHHDDAGSRSVGGAPDATAVEAGEGASHGHGEAAALTADQKIQLDAILADVEAATRRFERIRRAERAGFIQVTQYIPGLGMHMFNPRNAGSFDPVNPQILLYMPAGGDGWKLAGVAYSVPKSSDVPPAGFPGDSDVWHYHHNLCFLPGGSVTATTEQDCESQDGIFQATTGWLLHTWIYQPNPDGVFVEHNPTVN
jgi:hypothetical protein